MILNQSVLNRAILEDVVRCQVNLIMKRRSEVQFGKSPVFYMPIPFLDLAG